MPSPDTFSIPPIADLLSRWIPAGAVVVDPFARNSKLGTITNDLNPDTSAQYHMKADDFLLMLSERGEFADVVLFDPPYSPRQITECYQSAGLKATMEDTQSAKLKKTLRSLIGEILKPGGIVLSFGWNSCTFGDDFSIEEILLVPHGGDHNDTICVASRKGSQLNLFAGGSQ
jgi:hypothetical protein